MAKRLVLVDFYMSGVVMNYLLTAERRLSRFSHSTHAFASVKPQEWSRSGFPCSCFSVYLCEYEAVSPLFFCISCIYFDFSGSIHIFLIYDCIVCISVIPINSVCISVIRVISVVWSRHRINIRQENYINLWNRKRLTIDI